MTGILFFSACLAFAWLILFYAVPWVAREAILASFHAVRDRLWEATAEEPALRDTLTYRDIEWYLCRVQYAIRCEPLDEIPKLMPSKSRREEPLDPEEQRIADWRKRVTDREQERWFKARPKLVRAILLAYISAFLLALLYLFSRNGLGVIFAVLLFVGMAIGIAFAVMFGRGRKVLESAVDRVRGRMGDFERRVLA